MTFEEFIEELKFYLANEFGHDTAQMRYLPKGMTANSDNEALVISDTNLRYFDDESKELLGNFLITEFPEDVIPTSYKDAATIERFYLDALYQDCQNAGFTSVLEKLRKGKEESDLSKKSDTLDNVENYELTKAKLILRPLNYKNNRNILKEYIFRRVGDIALVVYMIIANENNNYMTAKLPRVTFEAWNISEDIVIDDALKNSQRLHPAKAAKVTRNPDLLTGIPTPRFVDLGLLKDVPASEFHNVPYISLFGQDNPNGAITLFFPGMMDWLYEKVGGAYYVVFTSIEDVAIHSVKVNNLKELKFKLANVNANLNKPEDILSRRVYKYNGVELLEIDWEERKAWLIDPAVYVGHAEADLAMTELFGGFNSRFYDAYNEVNRIDKGYHDRRDLYNLYHLLNHLNLFGIGYLREVKKGLMRYCGK